jgi:hypothetical protein
MATSGTAINIRDGDSVFLLHVVRVWQHEIERDLGGCVARIQRALKPARFGFRRFGSNQN